MSEKAIAINALEQFIVAAKLLNEHASAAELIMKVIDSPSVFSFSELLELPIIASMQNQPQYGPFYDLLKLFAYGTYLDYESNKEHLPQLTANSIMKLRHLSIVSLASKCRTIPYQKLCSHLGIQNIRELEDLIIEAFYADIIKGKLDQLENQLEIEFAIGRDVTDEQIGDILKVLDNWCSNCEIALKTIQTQIGNANSHKQKQQELQNSIDAEVANLKKSIKLQSQEVDAITSAKPSGKKSLKTKG